MSVTKGASLWDGPDQDEWFEITQIMAHQMTWWILSQGSFRFPVPLMCCDVSTLWAELPFVFLSGQEKGRLCFHHINPLAVILLHIVMVSPGTHLVKNHESQSRKTESQFKNQWVCESFVTTQLIWRQTPELCITVYGNKSILRTSIVKHSKD